MVKKLSRIILSLTIALVSIFVLIFRVFIRINWDNMLLMKVDIAYLKYFTSLSNFYNGFVFFYVFILSVIHFKDNDYKFNKFTKILVLSATSSVTITFLTTIFFLNFSLPNPIILYQNELIFFHVLNPIMSIVVFILLLPGENIKLKESLLGMIPQVTYSIFYSIFVLNHVWEDFYNFTFGGQYWTIAIALPVMLGSSFLINWVLSLLNSKLAK